MTEGEKEKIKLRANYLNGLSLIFMGLGGLGPVYTAMQTLETRSLAIALFFLLAGGMSSWELHSIARKELNKLDTTNEDHPTA
ncbi:hypothetical protein [Nitratireductor sp. ZSWI3]|uniref:hypothetical protein n=1 Tax=Nitratireductor sp. ZSWI3 TaxID=2966359 RepID=UPI00214F7AAD|nr:hypothetical protein [Nitratireductor sp. ZSWI3]MCR4267093.1 hypothetical protein [Nitratireductor sp. ZSWI3]